MWVRMATAPGSWGVEPPGDRTDPPWRTVLDEIAGAGFEGVELGPIGYLPEDPARLTEELRTRGLDLVAGYLMEPFHRAERAELLAIARRTCRVLAAAGARHLVLIEALEPVRAATAGRPSAAIRLDARRWATLVERVTEIAHVAAAEFGLRPAFHPHAGTYVEFDDEVERLLDETEPELVGLCVDTGHACYAGLDPGSLLEEHRDRASYLHVKDVRGTVLDRARADHLSFQEAVAAGVFCPLGEGMVDLAAVRRELEALDYHGWATFEQDRLAGDPGAQSDAERSLRHLRAIGIASGSGSFIGRSRT